MAVKFFGQFLIERGAVSPEILLKAIARQEEKNLKFGEMALAMGLITEKDLERVHQAQRAEDLRFGDMAIKLGMLSPAQMEEVLTRQKNSHLYIGEALVQVGGLGEADVSRYLAEFKEDQAKYLVDTVVIPSEAPEREFLELAADLTYKMLSRVANLSLRPDASMIIKEMGLRFFTTAMNFTGTLEGRYILTVSAGAQAAIARAIINEKDVTDEPKEVLDDTVMEFINIVLGNIVAKAAQMGKTIEIAPPEILEGTQPMAINGRTRGILFPFVSSDGELVDLVITLNI